MADVAVTYTFSANTTASASQVNQNFTDLVNYVNNRNSAISTWDNVNVTATTAAPVTIKSSAATTEVAIDNTATDGDPEITFKLSGSQTHVIGVDDSDSDFLKFATTGITTNVAMQIPTVGAQVQFNAGTALLPGVSFIGAPSYGFSQATTQLGISVGGVGFFVADFATSKMDFAYLGRPNADNTLTWGENGRRWSAIWAANGTIQTSVLSSKTNVESFDPDDVVIPEAIKFLRPSDTHNSKQLGFVADGLPEECFAVIDENGTRSTTDVYTSSIIGLLCSSIKKIKQDIEEIKSGK